MKTLIVIISVLTTIPSGGPYKYLVKEIEQPDIYKQEIKSRTGVLYSSFLYQKGDTIRLK